MKSLSILVLLSAVTAQSQYTCEELPMPPGYDARPTGINAGSAVGTAYLPGGNQRACVWEGPNYTFRLLSSIQSSADAISMGAQGGWVQVVPASRAVVWIDGGREHVNIHPPEFETSRVLGMDNDSFVGDALGYITGHQLHAILWQDFGSTVVRLHPAGYKRSSARALRGQLQVGVVQMPFGNETAAMWTGSAESMRTLPVPQRIYSSAASGVHSNVIVGQVSTGQGPQPALWRVDTMAFTKLQLPAAINREMSVAGFASATNGTVHVGTCWAQIYPTYDRDLAVAWVGDSPQPIVLTDFLPDSLGDADCHATGIDDEGNITGWAQSIYVGNRPLIWKPIKR